MNPSQFPPSTGLSICAMALSKRRAEAVKEWLVSKKGISEANITTEGLGETKPIAPNTRPDGSDNPQGRQQNRRVGIIVEKK